MDPIHALFTESHAIFTSSGVHRKVGQYYVEETFNIRPEVVGGRYMSKRVQKHISEKLHCKFVRQYIFDKTRMEVTIYAQNKSFDFDELYSVLDFYVFVLNRVVRGAAGPVVPVIHLTLYLTNLKKQFPAKANVVLDEDNINSGVTLWENDPEPNRKIVIYRKEELYKVLLHELIHYYSIDFHAYDPSYDVYLMKLFGISVAAPRKNPRNPLALYESYTDSIACYGHLLTHMLFKGEPTDRASVMGRVATEARFFTTQAAKVWKYGKLKEDTHAFSYYIVKAAIYRRFDAFMDLLATNGIRIDTAEKERDFLEFARSCIEDDGFWASLAKFRTRTIFLSTLRMSKIRW